MLKWRRTYVTKFFISTLISLIGCISQSQTIEPLGGGAAFKITCSEAQFVDLLNIYRRSNGLNTLEVSRSGVITARWHAGDMIRRNYFSHTEPNGRTFSQRASNFGYPSHAENIAAGHIEAIKTFCQWRNSPGHNANMLGRHRSTGIGLAVGKSHYGAYWSNGFSNAVGDELDEPITDGSTCVRLTALPKCPTGS